MNITFSIPLSNDRTLSEVDLADEAVFQREPGLRQLRELYGYLDLAHPGVADLRVEDDLPPLVAGLCLQAPPKLRRGEPVRFDFASYFGHLTLEPAGETVRVTTDRQPEPREYPAAELADALAECGARFAAFFRRLAAGHEQWEALSGFLDQPAAPPPTDS